MGFDFPRVNLRAIRIGRGCPHLRQVADAQFCTACSVWVDFVGLDFVFRVWIRQRCKQLRSMNPLLRVQSFSHAPQFAHRVAVRVTPRDRDQVIYVA